MRFKAGSIHNKHFQPVPSGMSEQIKEMSSKTMSPAKLKRVQRQLGRTRKVMKLGST